MTDIVKRLEREVAEHNGFSWPMDAHEITFVQDDVRMLAAAEITRLREALAARTEECARVADDRAFRWVRQNNTERSSESYEIAAAIRGLERTSPVQPETED